MLYDAHPVVYSVTDFATAEPTKKSTQWDKDAIQRNHPHYKGAAQAPKKDDLN